MTAQVFRLATLLSVSVLSFTTPAFSAEMTESPRQIPPSAQVESSAVNAGGSPDKMISFRYENGELTKMVADYAKASGRKMILDPSVRGRATVLLNSDVSLNEAWNILNDVFAINGFSIVDRGDTTVVVAARNAQRDGIPTLTTLPPPRPNRMVTVIFTLKNISAEEVNKRLRILPSKDGEMTPYEPSNQIIVSDYATNVNRIAEILKAIDVPESFISKKVITKDAAKTVKAK